MGIKGNWPGKSSHLIMPCPYIISIKFYLGSRRGICESSGEGYLILFRPWGRGVWDAKEIIEEIWDDKKLLVE